MLIKEQAIAVVRRSIKKLDWKYQYDEVKELFTIKWRPVYFFASLQMHIYIFDKSLTIVVSSDATVKKNISRVAEYLTRLNYSLSPGALEMDCDDGDVRFYLRLAYSEISGNGEQTEESMRMFVTFMLVKGLMTYDACGDGLFTVMFGVESPKKAAKKAEALMDKLSGNNNDDDDDDDDDDDTEIPFADFEEFIAGHVSGGDDDDDVF